jgi:hypothetical protein
MEPVGEHPVPAGPLAARWLALEVSTPRAGALGRARVRVENAGSATWREDVLASYHWLDELGNPIVWDGLRTPLAGRVTPGERILVELAVRAPIPFGRYRVAFDLVAEHRAWFGELGNTTPDREVEVRPRVESDDLRAVAEVHLPTGVEPAPGWEERVLAAHAEGYAVVAGSIEAPRRLRRALEPWAPGQGRVPGFPHPLLCPSALRGVALDRLPDVHGLPAFAPPRDEPWLYDGRLTARLRSGRPRG